LIKTCIQNKRNTIKYKNIFYVTYGFIADITLIS
jgi:hypothetical protein